MTTFSAAEQRFALNAFSQLSAAVVGLAAGGVLSIVLARALGPEVMGSYALALVIVGALKAATGFGLSRTALRFAAEFSDQPVLPRVLWWLLVRRSGAAALAAIALAVAAPWLGMLFGDSRLPPLLQLGAGLLLVEQLGGILESVLEGTSRFDLLARARIWPTPLSLAAALGAVALGGGVVAVMLVQLVFALVDLALLAGFTRRVGALHWSPGTPEPALAARMIRFARQGYWLSMVTFVVHDRSEVLLLGALTTSREVGLYSVALRTAGVAMSLGPWIVVAVFFPLLATAWARSDRRALVARYAQCVRYLAFAAAPLALGGIVVAEAGVEVVFGPAYAPMVPVLRLTLLASVASALADGPAAVLAAAERQDLLLRVNIPLAIANLLLDLILVPRFAALGAAWAYLAIATASALLLTLLAWRLCGAIPPMSTALPFVAAGIAAAAAALVLGERHDAVGLAMSLLVATPLYFVALGILRFFRRDDAALMAPAVTHLPLPVRDLARRLLDTIAR